MNRRRYLISVGSIPLVPGCTGILGNNRTLGESAEYRGVEVTPEKYITTSAVQVDGGAGFTEYTPSQGATFLLTYLHVEHTGENKRVFPIRGQSAISTNIETSHNGETLRSPSWESYSKFRLKGTELTPYMESVDPNDFYEGVFSGSASGWIVDEISEEFSPSDVSITITWGASTHTANPEYAESHTWKYTSEVETSIEQQ